MCVWMLLAGGSGFTEKEAVGSDALSLSIHRYREGLDLQRLLYEKLLELDHHFAGDHMWVLPGPEGQTDLTTDEMTAYLPVFEMDESNCSRVYRLDWYLARRAVQRAADRLQLGNDLLVEDARHLFQNYTSILGYQRSLSDCRNRDDWDLIRRLLDEYEARCRKWLASGQTADADQAHIDLEFSVDRLLDFVAEYRRAVRRGIIHYRYYQRVLNRFADPPTCVAQADVPGLKLIEQVARSRKKYQSAYDLAELEGSRLKKLLYGFDP